MRSRPATETPQRVRMESVDRLFREYIDSRRGKTRLYLRPQLLTGEYFEEKIYDPERIQAFIKSHPDGYHLYEFWGPGAKLIKIFVNPSTGEEHEELISEDDIVHGKVNSGKLFKRKRG